MKIFSQGKLQVDCEFEGDVAGTEVVISEQGKVKGTVAGDRVIVLGKIFGAILGNVVALKSSAHVEGDIRHKSLDIEKGALSLGRWQDVAFLELDGPRQGRQLFVKVWPDEIPLPSNGKANGSGTLAVPRALAGSGAED